MQEAPSPPPPTVIPSSDWEQTPVSVKRWVENLLERIKELEQQQAAQQQQLGELQTQIQLLQEKQNCTSSNSSTPPSLDPPQARKRRQKKSSGKKSLQTFPPVPGGKQLQRVDNQAIKGIVGLCIRWSSVRGSSTTIQNNVRAAVVNCMGKMPIPIATK